MQLKVQAFGLLAEIVGNNIIVDKQTDTDSLKKQLAVQFPSLVGIKYAIAVDKKIIAGNTLINEASIIALLPPFSGG